MPKTKDGFFKFHWSLFRSGMGHEVGPHAGWLLCALQTYANPLTGEDCFPSNERLAKDTHMGVSSVIAAKKKLKEVGLIDYKIVRMLRDNPKPNQSKHFNRTYYKLKPVQVTGANIEIPEGLSSDLVASLETLDSNIKGLPKEAAYLQASMRTLRTMKVYKQALQVAKAEGIKADKIYLHFALNTIIALKTFGAHVKKPFYARVKGQAANLVKFADKMFEASDLLPDSLYEQTIAKFMDWMRENRSGKSLNYGILPLLAEDWLSELRD